MISRSNLFTNIIGLFLGLAISSCGVSPSQPDSTIKIIDGIEIPDEIKPSVVFLFNPLEGTVCTGTFVQQQVVLAAGHCTTFVDNVAIEGANEELGSEILILRFDETLDQDNDPTNGIEGGFVLVAASTRVFRHPLITAQSIGESTANDLSLIYFGDYVSPSVSFISPVEPQLGAAATIVGFGADSIFSGPDDTSVGFKRIGSVTVDSVGEFIAFFDPPVATSCTTTCGKNSNAAPGDSGGPMFVNDQIVGVTHGGSELVTAYVNINSPDSKAFIDAVEVALNVKLN